MLPPSPPAAPPTVTAERAAAWLETFVEGAGTRTPEMRSFPVSLLARLAEERTLPDHLEPTLHGVLVTIGRMDLSSAEGEDLLLEAHVWPAIARLVTPTERMVRRALLALEATNLDRHYAEPGGGNPDKFDRDSDREHAQDKLAFALVEALARLGAAAPADAATALAKACKHRSLRVRSTATEVLRLVEDDYLRR